MAITFVDQAKIYLKAGSGGKGCASLYRDKYRRQGSPDGGPGGRGADIVFRADRNLFTLLDFKYNQHFRADHGAAGESNHKKGREGKDLFIRVPAGTTLTDSRSGCILRDLKNDGDEVIVCRGGAGGAGNHKRNLLGSPGEPGEEKEIILDLKLIAEVGVVGFPNAGKSTLVSVVSNARPAIAAYPFTTKTPVLGVVSVSEKTFVIADIPGLIAGSAQGRGLGDRFLRHIERTKILIHLLDMSGESGREALEDYRIINNELKNYSAQVAGKTQILVANKTDLSGAKKNLKKFKKSIKKKIYPISALNKEGLTELIHAVAEKL